MKLYSFLISLILLLPLIGFSETTSKTETKILILGDSLTEGYGVSKDAAYSSLLDARLNSDPKTSSRKWKVINSGVSGATTSSLPSRLKWLLSAKTGKPDWIIIALGANDGLRGFDHQESEKNLASAIEKIQSEKIKVILFGMAMPPNYGKKYTEEYRKIFPALAKKYKVPLLPFLLDGVAGKSDLNLSDGIHPNEKGHKIMAEKVFNFLKDIL